MYKFFTLVTKFMVERLVGIHSRNLLTILYKNTEWMATTK